MSNGSESCVLVTGAGAGAGRVIAERFAATGARVAIADISADAIAGIEQSNPNLLCVCADVSRPDEVAALVDRVTERHGPIDVLVNNVGIAGPTAATESVSVADWERTLSVNLTSHFLCARAVIPGMKQAGAGLIVNVSSASARTGLPLRTPYVVTKAAVLGLTRNLARELGPFGIRVNAILPGAIEGERLGRVIDSKARAMGTTPEAYAREMFRFISLRTAVTPDDVASMILFLASAAGARISGQLIGVDGHVVYEE